MNLPEALLSDAPLTWSAGRGRDVGALFVACVEGDLETVRQLLDRDPSLVRCQHGYRTPLYFAVRENRLEIAALLIARGGDPLSLAFYDSLLEMAHDRGYREMERWLRETLLQRFGAGSKGEALAAAIRSRDLQNVRALLDASPELLHAGDARSNQPIHWAVMTRQPDLIDLLLARGADINARRFDGARPIHLTNGDYHYRGWRDVPESATATPNDIYNHLVRCGAEVDLGMAAAKGDMTRVRELLDGDPSLVNRVCDYGSYYVGCGAPLKNAVVSGQLELVRLFLERGADPNLPEEGIAPHGHALYSAVERGHFEIAKLLLEHGANPNAAVESSADALSRAISRGDQPMVDLLCAHGAARSVELLAYYNDLRTAAAVFAANPALADDPEALSCAASGAFVRLMLRYQPGLPQRLAVAKDPETTELLFQHGMDPNHRDWLGATLLHAFARKGEVENAALFLRHGADLHARDDDLCSTPLGHAAKFGQVGMVEFLLRHGARVRLPDDPPWATPLAWAERRGHAEVAEVLRHHALWGVLPLRRALEDYDALAAWLVDGCNSGSEKTLRGLQQELRLDRTPTPDQIREIVRRRAPGMKDDGELAWSEAREWVAVREGFVSWDDLETHLTGLAHEHQRVTAWKAVDQAVAEGDDEGLEKLMAEHAEPLAKRPKGAYPACGTAFDFTKGARTLIAREHHFENWEAFALHRAERRDPTTPTAAFEDAVEAVVSGDEGQLRRLLAADGGLIRARSSRSHRATLLHYLGANGVEGFRQRTPPNAVEIAEVLLGAGAEVDAVAGMYGGATVLGLAATSVHPWLAGVQLDLLRTLLAHGASIDHPQGGVNPLTPILGCLANGRQEAAEFLAAHGASLDLEAAAGVGRLDRVRWFVDDQGGLRNGATEAQRQSGFHWACEYGRTEVVEYLLTRGADLVGLHRGRTGLHWAAYGGHLEIVRLLLNKGAPVEVVDATYRTTPLGWALYGWFQPPSAGALLRYPAVVEELVKRGAVVRPEWRADVRVRNDLRMRRALA